MSRMRNLPTIIIVSALTVLLVVAVVTTIILAQFNASNKAMATFKFADDVTLVVQGIDSSNNWQVATKSATTTYIVDSATISAPFYRGIDVKVTGGASANTPVVVRIFAIVYTTNSTINSISRASTTTLIAEANYTTQEKALISSVPKNSSGTQYKYAVMCVTREFNDVQTSFSNMISDFYPLGEELSSSHYGAKMQGIVVVTAKSRSVTHNQTITVSDWNAVINFSNNGIAWA